MPWGVKKSDVAGEPLDQIGNMNKIVIARGSGIAHKTGIQKRLRTNQNPFDGTKNVIRDPSSPGLQGE